MTAPFIIDKPKTAPLPIIFDSPHSGKHYPDDFNYACAFNDLQTAEDHYVDDLFSAAPNHGAHFLKANFPRSYIDPNRAHDDIDHALLDEDWSGPFLATPSVRGNAGIGLIRRLIRPGIPVYNRPLTSAEIMHRIENYYHPYHDALETLIKDAHYNFGQVWHINCHSMPNETAYPRRSPTLAGNQSQPVDFVLGDRDCTTCSNLFTRSLRELIKSMGYTVSINDPFKGVEIIRRHSSPARGMHSLQLEINKALYMNEETGKKTQNYKKLKTDIETIITFTADYALSHLDQIAAD
jgi:N-formylglutamate deformylase